MSVVKSHLKFFSAKSRKCKNTSPDLQNLKMERSTNAMISKNDFMELLGMQRTHESRKDSVTDTSNTLNDRTSSSNDRVIKRPYTKKQLVAVLKYTPFSTARAQQLWKHLGENFKRSLSPVDESPQRKLRSTRARSQQKRSDRIKASVLKDGQHPHIFTFGSRQRELRRQELIIGLNAKKWPTLNCMKKARVEIEKLKVCGVTQRITKKQAKPFLEQCLKAALTLPHIEIKDMKKSGFFDKNLKICTNELKRRTELAATVRVSLVDCVKHPSLESQKYLKV